MSTDLFKTPSQTAPVRTWKPTSLKLLKTLDESWAKQVAERNTLRTDEAREKYLAATQAYRNVMRDLRADSKALDKAKRDPEGGSFFNAERRAAHATVWATRGMAFEAWRVKRKARKAYPRPMWAVAAMRNGATAGATAGTWLFCNGFVAATSATLTVAAGAVSVALGWRHRNKDVAPAAPGFDTGDLVPSQEEMDLLQRLVPDEWARVAAPRGLADTVATAAALTNAGIQVKLTLQGQMTVDKLKKMDEQLRAALRLREGTRLEVRAGKTGGHARLTLRTRTAADGISLKGWKPGDPWGIDTVTGEPVYVPLGRRMLVAGTTGSGKSWSMRCVLAEASEYADHRLVVLDRKLVEAKNWAHRARTGITPDDFLVISDELIDEMYERLALIPRGKDVIEISAQRPRITVFVDEGSELLSCAEEKSENEDGKMVKQHERITANLRTLARMARAAEIIILWATQKPTLSGESPGLDSQIAAQITCRASLSVSTQTEARVIFGDDAIEKGWHAHELPSPGYAMLRDSNQARPNPIRTRAMSADDVIALPSKPIWHRAGDRKAPVFLDGDAVRESGSDAPTVVMDKVAAPKVLDDREKAILDALRADPCTNLTTLAASLGWHHETVNRVLIRLSKANLVWRDQDKCWHPNDF